MLDRPRRVALFVTCLVDLLYPEVGEAAAALLRDTGAKVDFPEAQVCCGQPAFNSGFDEDARRVARTLLDAFDGAEAVVTPSGSCAAMIRVQFPRLFLSTSLSGRAQALAARTFELTEFLSDVAGWRPRGSWDGAVTYHDACHGLRELGLRGHGLRLVQPDVRTFAPQLDGGSITRKTVAKRAA